MVDFYRAFLSQPSYECVDACMHAVFRGDLLATDVWISFHDRAPFALSPMYARTHPSLVGSWMSNERSQIMCLSVRDTHTHIHTFQRSLCVQICWMENLYAYTLPPTGFGSKYECECWPWGNDLIGYNIVQWWKLLPAKSGEHPFTITLLVLHSSGRVKKATSWWTDVVTTWNGKMFDELSYLDCSPKNPQTGCLDTFITSPP